MDRDVPTTLPIATLEGRLGQEVATSPWHRIDQGQIDRFAALTGDTQWIHLDAVRAAASPFGATIAHGFLTLSLLTVMMQEAFEVEGASTAINYGLNRVRFVTPVRADARIRARFVPIAVASVSGGVQVTWTVTVDLDGAERPAMIAEWIVRYGDGGRPA